jgi:carbon-monoxide dehydrogenase large subunit
VKGSLGAQDAPEIAFAAYTNLPDGMRPASRRSTSAARRTPPPFGGYICVVDHDKDTGEVHVLRFVNDDCGNIINR